MSTRQQQLAELDTTPDWLQGYDDPVVRTQGRGNNSTMHLPDYGADEPKPACPQANANNSFVVSERAHLEGFYSECRNPECYGGGHE